MVAGVESPLGKRHFGDSCALDCYRAMRKDMPSYQPHELAQQELRSDLIVRVDQAIFAVRDLVAQLNEREKEYMHTNSAVYRQLVDTIKNWDSSR